MAEKILLHQSQSQPFIFTKALTSKSIYPVLWLGEKSISVSRLARLVKLVNNIDNNSQYFMYYVGRAEGEYEETEIRGIYIISGGIHPPRIGKVKKLWSIKRYEMPDNVLHINRTTILIPSGIGSITNAIEIEEAEIEWEEREPSKLPLLYDPPQRFKVVKYTQHSDKYYALEILL